MGEIKLNIGLVLSGQTGGSKFLSSISCFLYLPYVFSGTSMAFFVQIELAGEQEQDLSSMKKVCEIPGIEMEEEVEDVDSTAAGVV